ncbi:MAG: caspase family protein [Pseudomonadota bacterium]
MILRSLLISAVLAGTSAHHAAADNYALVIGINDYETQTDLGGAVNDAQLIAGALQEFGVSDLRVLLDRDATYDAVSGAWNELLDQAESGDTLILTYAGHGDQLEDISGDEASASQPDDRTDEMLVLSGYNPQDPQGRGERIVDDELHQWFLAAGDKGVQVVFVADSCFSGTVSRGGRARLINAFQGLDDGFRRKPLVSNPETEEETIENVVFLAGSQEAEVVVEVEIDGRYHGALSYAFARALSMAGDVDGDGVLGRDDLATFLPRTAQSFNGARYLPEINPRRGPDFAVLKPDQDAAKPAGTLPTGGGGLGQATDPNLFPIAAAPGTTWDKRTGDITDATGEILGHNVPQDRLADVNHKFELLALAKEGLVRNGLDITFRVDGDPWHREMSDGTLFDIEVGPLPAPYLTVFNLANNGEVQLVYPVDAAEREPLAPGSKLSFDAEAIAPFGSDELVAIVTPEEPADLRQALIWAMPAGQIVPIVSRLLAGGNAAFGHHSIVTKEH